MFKIRAITPLVLFVAVAGIGPMIEVATPTARGQEPRKHRRLVFLEPDLKIGKELPKGWSNLVSRSIPSLRSGEIGSLPSVAAETTTLFHTNILLDIRRGKESDSGFELSRVGLAICVPVDGVDTVVRSKGPCAARDSLGLVERQVVPRAEEQLARVRIMAKTPTMIVLRAPTTFKVGEHHREVCLYYAITVNPATGIPTTFLWIRPMDETTPEEKVYSAVPARILPPGLKYDCPLDVTANRLLGTIPVGWSFAMTKMPPGHKVPHNSAIKPWVTHTQRIQDDPETFEAVLSEFLDAQIQAAR